MWIDRIVAGAQRDAETALAAGFDGYVIENFGDVPFFPRAVPPIVLTVMTRVAVALEPANAIAGVNVLRNDARGALAVAAAARANFIRVNVHTGAVATDQGIIEGRAAETMREREAIAPTVAVFADVDVKHGAPVASRYDISEAAKDTAYRGLADGLIVSGRATGSETSLDDLRRVADAVPDRPLFVGSGATAENVAEMLGVANGVLVGTAIKVDACVSAPVDAARAREFVRAAGR